MIARALGLVVFALAACAGPPFPPSTGEHNDQVIAITGSDGGGADLADMPKVEEKDPTGGRFTLEEATATMPGSPGGTLAARITTSLGVIQCDLFADKAPVSVANFVGLARGLRPFKGPDGHWVKRPAYDGTTFHRVIKGFMIQGGDPKGNGTGDPGFVIPDEIWPGATHDRAGQLCMANRGPNTNGMQFFITEAAVPRLDGNYTIFGQCTPTSIVTAIATVPKGPRDKPDTPVKIDKVEIYRYVTAQGGPADAGR